MTAATAGHLTRTGAACAGLLLPAGTAWPRDVAAQSLRGGEASLRAQYLRAPAYDDTFLTDPAHVRHFVNHNLLVPVKGNRDYQLDDEVSFPYARPEVLTFIERLSRQYRAACGEVLVVTSLTRPKSHQPRNSSKRWSVHPTGMAVDLRRSNTPACRNWIQRVLLELEGTGVVQATHERRPPHYHIAVYTKEYADYVARLEADEPVLAQPESAVAAQAAGEADESTVASSVSLVSYKVRSGDSLWSISRAHRITVAQLKMANKLTSNRIYAGQWLDIPVRSR